MNQDLYRDVFTDPEVWCDAEEPPEEDSCVQGLFPVRLSGTSVTQFVVIPVRWTGSCWSRLDDSDTWDTPVAWRPFDAPPKAWVKPTHGGAARKIRLRRLRMELAALELECAE